MRFVIGVIALLVLGSIFGSIAGLLFLPELSSNLAHSEQHHSSENCTAELTCEAGAAP
jgi:hypothetical protein